jgi:hypothetical protein
MIKVLVVMAGLAILDNSVIHLSSKAQSITESVLVRRGPRDIGNDWLSVVRGLDGFAKQRKVALVRPVQQRYRCDRTGADADRFSEFENSIA